ncbi:MAG TPA: hypothetical protein VGG29_03890, partial [Caulobacteraceae bacterium]
MGQVLVVSGNSAAVVGVAGNAALLGSTSARLGNNAAGAALGAPMPAAGTFSGLSAANGAVTGTWSLAFRKNLANGAQSISNAAVTDAAHTDTVAAGDVVDGLWGGGGGGPQRVTMAFLGATGHWALYASANQSAGNSVAAGATVFPSIAGGPGASATETTGVLIGAPGTLSGMFVGIAANAATATSTAASRGNGVTGAQSAAIGAGLTGRFRDPSGQDTVAKGDLVNGMLTNGGGGALSILSFGFGFLCSGPAANDHWVSLSATSSTPIFLPLATGFAGSSATEAPQQVAFGFSATLSLASISVTANSCTGTSTYATRRNGAAGGQSAAIGAGLSGWFRDPSGQDILAPTDLTAGLVTPNAGSLTINLTGITSSPFFTVSAQAQTAPAGSIARGRALQGAAQAAAALARSTGKALAAAAVQTASLARQTAKNLTDPGFPGAALSLRPLNASLSSMEGLAIAWPYLYVTAHASQIAAKIDLRLYPDPSSLVSTLDLTGFGNPFALGSLIVGARWLYIFPHSSSGLAKLLVFQIDLTLWDQGPEAAVTVLDLSTILPSDPRGADLAAACSGGCTDGEWLYLSAGGGAKNKALGIPSLIRIGTGANFIASSVSMLDMSSLADPAIGKASTGVGQPVYDAASNAVFAVINYGDAAKLVQSSGLVRVDAGNLTLGGVIQSTPVNSVQEAFAVAGASVFAAPGIVIGTLTGAGGPLIQYDAATLAQTASFDLIGAYGQGANTEPVCCCFDGDRRIYVAPNSGTACLVIDVLNPGKAELFDFTAIDPATTGGYNVILPDPDNLWAYALPFAAAPSGPAATLLRFRMRQPTDSFGAAAPAPSLSRRTGKAAAAAAAAAATLLRGPFLQALSAPAAALQRGRALQAQAPATGSIVKRTSLALNVLAAAAGTVAA